MNHESYEYPILLQKSIDIELQHQTSVDRAIDNIIRSCGGVAKLRLSENITTEGDYHIFYGQNDYIVVALDVRDSAGHPQSKHFRIQYNNSLHNENPEEIANHILR